jgi:hypothetical protein
MPTLNRRDSMIRIKKEEVFMDKEKIFLSAMNRSYGDRVPTAIGVLGLVCAIAGILVSFGTVAYANDDTSGASIQEHALIVKNWKGEYIGTSHHVVMDPSTGNIIFIIVSLEQEENKEIAVPTGLFSIDEKQGVLVLNISKKQLDLSPSYHASDLQDPEFFEKVYRFFAIAPPWAEETPRKENEPLSRF